MNNDILNRLESAQTDEAREWLVMQFTLENLAPEIRDAVWAAAIPHWFDADFLTALTDEPLSASEFQTLTTLSFAEEFPEHGFNIHERTRNLLLKRLWQDEPERYRELSRRAASYCEKQNQDDTAWKIETVYHFLIADPDVGTSLLQDIAVEWHNPPNFAYDKVEALAKQAREHADVNRLNELGIALTLYWEAHIDQIYSRCREAKAKLLEIKLSKIKDKLLKANCIRALGDVHRMLDEYEDARARYAEARPIYSQIGARLGEANCIKALGDVHIMLSEYEDARARYAEARPIYSQIGDRLGEANCIRALGDVHIMLSEYEDARARYAEARPIYSQIGDRLGEANCIKALGDVHIMLSEYEDARARYAEARPIYSQIGARLGEANCIKALGDVHRMLDEYEDAVTQYEKAMPTYKEIGDRYNYAEAFAYMGLAFKGLKQNEQTHQYLQQALKLFEEIKSPRADVVRQWLDELNQESASGNDTRPLEKRFLD
ncbi:tetratricopeptide repeat protein [Desulfococcaceae bacterium HSG7]|nr:tetratricopeptide repeat protein [Desulfococcaceae bacterium HSG7]